MIGFIGLTQSIIVSSSKVTKPVSELTSLCRETSGRKMTRLIATTTYNVWVLCRAMIKILRLKLHLFVVDM